MDIIRTSDPEPMWPYDPNYADKVLRASDRGLAQIIKASQRRFDKYAHSTAELRQKYLK